MYKIVLFILLICSFNVNAESKYIDYVVGEGDEIKVSVYRSADLETLARVAADGTISFPLMGKLSVAGKTTAQIESIISNALIEKQLLVSPQVNVAVTDYQSKTFAVFGHVASPGKYPLKRPMKLTDAVAVAGGYKLTAADVVTVVSEADGKAIKKSYDAKRILEDISGEGNPQIKSGDIIQVPKHAVFYIHGQVNNPGEYKVEPNMRVSQALAKGGGVSLRGTTRSMVIERTTKDGKVNKIRAKMDVIVQPNDVIFVDESLF